MADINRQWRLKRRPEAGELIGKAHFELVEAPVPGPEKGQILVRTLVLGTAPAQRAYVSSAFSMHEKVDVGAPMRGRGVGVVVESRHGAFKAGDIVTASLGWQDYSIQTPTAESMSVLAIARIADPVRPYSLHLGVLGAAGATAYFGLVDIGQAKPGDTVVVSAAAGGIGALVGQIAKIGGCRVVGICGTAEKGRWITEDLKYDAAINYRTEDVRGRLRELCPGGIDVFFDNVGGDTLDAALENIALGGRVVICGYISTDTGVPSPGPANYKNLLRKRARMEGFYVFDYLERLGESETRFRRWLAQGLIKPCEDVDHGLENMPETLASLFKGANQGIKLNRVAPDP